MFNLQMDSLAPKYKSTVEEAVAHLISRAENSRGLEADDLRLRVVKAVDKYVLRDNENADRSEIKEFVDEIRADDFCLVIACEKGIESAWGDLVTNFDQTVKSAAYKFAKNKEDAEDLAGSIWAELYGLRVDKKGNKKSKLAYYSGRGSLGGWLRAVTNQLAIDQFRKMKRIVQIEEDREFDNLASESAGKDENFALTPNIKNPEEDFSEKQAETDVANALQEAIKELEAEDKLLLKLYYFDDLKLKDLGKTFGFHEATASRKLARIQANLRKTVEKNLQENRGWQAEEVKRHLSETASNLGLNIETMFGILIFFVVAQEIIRSSVL